MLKDCQKLTAITSCYSPIFSDQFDLDKNQNHQGQVEQDMGNLACKQAFLFGQGVQAVKLDLPVSGDSGHLASLFSSRSIHELMFTCTVSADIFSSIYPR